MLGAGVAEGLDQFSSRSPAHDEVSLGKMLNRPLMNANCKSLWMRASAK